MTSDDNDAALQHPHDLEAEKGVLRAMLLSQDAIADLVAPSTGTTSTGPPTI